MEIFVLYLFIILLVVLYCIWQYKRCEFVKKNSKCYKDLLEYNKTTTFNQVENKIVLYKRCNSKSQFDNFDNDKSIDFLSSVVEEEFVYYDEIKAKIKDNIEKYDKYIVDFNRLVNDNPFDYDSVVQNGKMSGLQFRKIEVCICEKEMIKPQLDVEVVINVSYISPRGRNRYFKQKTINLEGLEYIFELREQKIEYRKSVQYVRASVYRSRVYV